MQPQNSPYKRPAPTPASVKALDLIKVELEHYIPIKHPGQPARPTVTPITPIKQFVEADGQAGKDLDSVLKDASQGVKNLAKAPSRPRFSLTKLLPKRAVSVAKTAQSAPKSSYSIVVA